VDADGQREVLGQFLGEYIPALRAHLRFRSFFDNDADNEDLLADFVVDKFVANNLLENVKEGPGLLRSFLKTCLNNYAISQLRKRKPLGSVGMGITEDEVNPTFFSESEQSADPFDLAWARNVVARAIELMYEDCMKPASGSSKPNQSHIWAVFEGRLVLPITGQANESVSYEQLRLELDADSLSQVHNWFVTGQRKFQKQLMRVILEYAPTEEQATQEIQDLFSILGKASRMPCGDSQ